MSHAPDPDAILRQSSASLLTTANPDKLGVAVSGGGDSMALLDLMVHHAAEMGIEIAAVTVDHGLRPESADEARFVARFCDDRAIPHDTLKWHRPDGGGNLQADARDARYRLIAAWARRRGIACVALGHTKDDQAETFLMRLARKAGVDGLAAMDQRFERHGVAWLRPLLGHSREGLRAYLRRHDITWIDDPTNDDPGFDRIRARQAQRQLNDLGITIDALSDVSQNLARARRALEHYTVNEADRLVAFDRGDIVITRNPTPPVPGEIDRRLILSALQWMCGSRYAPRQSALAELEAALVRDGGLHTLSGCLLSQTAPEGVLNKRLRIAREWNAVKDLKTPTNQVWDRRWTLDGPHTAELHIGALGEAVNTCPDWRETGLPRTSLLASPAIWLGDTLIAAPVAGLGNGWTASATGQREFHAFLISH